ncbi:hypothetical protein GJAV_G00108340 [Gymnothorax javanicus]|nr:hypothetical protein GJAV_G00108340 [Gymnothorax javanicus]
MKENGGFISGLRMPPFLIGLFLGVSLLLQTRSPVRAQENAYRGPCADRFRVGREDFVLNAQESVKDGAMFLRSPNVQHTSQCVKSCCGNRHCDLALIENDSEGDTIKSCFLFKCRYKKRYVCRFVKRTGYSNFILSSVYEKYLAGQDGVSEDGDKFPIANGGPDQVVQPGQNVTLSGVESKDDQGIASYEWTLLNGDQPAVIEKTKHDDEVLVTNLIPGEYDFQLTVKDTAGQSATAEVKVHVLTAEESDSYCRAPPKVGPCRAAFRRWYYDSVTHECVEFLFGGCKSNLNNYLSEAECSRACEGISAASGRSAPPPKAEVCGAPCAEDQFDCGNDCCVDGELECDSVNQCSNDLDEKSCQALNSTFGRLLEVPVNEDLARCTEPPVTGRCRASMARWYYDPMERTCHPFDYGGCDGNDNNFLNMDTCMETCKSVTEKDLFSRSGFQKSTGTSNKGQAALAIILAVASLVLLAVVGYCFVKRKRQRPLPPMPGATPVPTSEDAKHPVYNSTTKPI